MIFELLFVVKIHLSLIKPKDINFNYFGTIKNIITFIEFNQHLKLGYDLKKQPFKQKKIYQIKIKYKKTGDKNA